MKVAYWDNIEVQRPLSLNEFEEKVAALEAFKGWASMEETSYTQRSREIWLKEGGRNTWYFHRIDNSQRRRNQIRRLRINGVWATEDGVLRLNVVNAFKTLLAVGWWKLGEENLLGQLGCRVP